ncbi:MAG: AbaSI family restriction endonuclease [Romboutsia timonensis]
MVTGTKVVNYDGVDFLVLFNGDVKWYIAKQIADYLEYSPNNPNRATEVMCGIIRDCPECKLTLNKKGNEAIFDKYKNLDKTVSNKTNNILLVNDIALLYFLNRTDKNKNKVDGLVRKFVESDLSIFPYLDKKEMEFIERLEQTLLPFDIKGVKQYTVKNNKNSYYRIDYYIPSLNIAIEYDEKQHKYQQEEDKVRQTYIEQELGCKFIRVTDDYSDEYNIGLIIKEMFNL